MFAPFTVIAVLLLYMAGLFAVAYWAEKRVQQTGRTRVNPLIYVLSLAVFSTTWEFYGNVGYAVNHGLQFLAVQVGALLAIAFWWVLLRKMVHLKEAHRITSIADFISARYNRSHWVAATVTVMALLGIVPYIALQLKALVGTFSIISTYESFVFDISTGELTPALDWQGIGVLFTLFLILFTVVFGVRRLDPTERHQGVVIALALECIVKLAALGTVCIYVTYTLFDGFGDLFQRIVNEGHTHLLSAGRADLSTFSLWASFMVLGAAGIQFLPRQFHVAVVENSDERHIRWAMVLLPLYLILLNLFVLPIAGGGLLMGIAPELADFFVLLLPQQHGDLAVALCVFIGGFAAATGMIILSTMTLSTMVTNHLLLPVIEQFQPLQPLRRYLLQCRWLAVTLILIFSHWFAQALSASYQLTTIGVLSLVAMLQFAPAILGGLFWRRGNRAGALLGLHAGFLLWIYTLILPLLADQGVMPATLVQAGPWGIDWLRPTALFGLDALPPVPHAVFWSLLFNGGLYLLAALAVKVEDEEETQALDFVRPQSHHLPSAERARPTGLHEYIELPEKLEEAKALLCRYMKPEKAKQALKYLLEDLQVDQKKCLSIMELVELHRLLERVLAGSIGAAAAHRAVAGGIHYSERERHDLEQVYSHIRAELHATPREREQQLAELEDRLREQEMTIRQYENRLAEQTRELHAKEQLIQRLQAENEQLQSGLQPHTTKKE